MTGLDDEVMAGLLEDGSITEVTIANDGEFELSFDFKKLNYLHPGIHDYLIQDELQELWEDTEGLVDRTETIEGNVIFTLTDEGEHIVYGDYDDS